MLRAYIFWSLQLLVCAFAWTRGGRPERIVAFSQLAAGLVSIAVAAPAARPFTTIEWGIAVVDLALFSVITWVALTSKRFWPIPLAAVALLMSLGHVFRAVTPNLEAWFYYLDTALWSWIMVAILFVGVVAHDRRIKRERAGIA
jgi:hypothetical protein